MFEDDKIEKDWELRSAHIINCLNAISFSTTFELELIFIENKNPTTCFEQMPQLFHFK